VQPGIHKPAPKQPDSTAPVAEVALKRRRPLLSLLMFCILAVAGSAFAFAVVIAGASVALANHQSPQAEEPQTFHPVTAVPTGAKTFSGMITDSHCGARHRRNTRQSSTDCALACVRKGSTYVLVDGGQRYTLIGGDSALSQLAGQRANVTGTRQGDTIIVDAAAPMF
jgi:hypothetical protein